ncbi:MAG: ComF family protein [Verrucomicrobiota bacterium]
MKLEPLSGLISLFYPPSCAVCECATAPGQYLCSTCEKRALRIVPPFCEKCSESFPGAIDGSFVCPNCSHRRLYFDAAVSAYRSRGVVRFVMLRFKYNRQLHLRHLIGQWLRRALEDDRLRERSFDFLVPVPLHPARRRERGFNQAELLAGGLSHDARLPVRHALERIRYTTTQTALDRAERMENLRDAFRLRSAVDVRNSRVLLVDDILTTGSTLSECARVLRRGGAASVCAITAARA